MVNRNYSVVILWTGIACAMLVGLPQVARASDVPRARYDHPGQAELSSADPARLPFRTAGMASSPMSSPGLVVTSTLYDLQHLSSSGRQIDRWGNHIAACFTTGDPGGQREMRWWSGRVAGSPAPVSLLDGSTINALPLSSMINLGHFGAWPGFPTMHILPDSGVLMAYHDYTDGDRTESFPVAAIDVLPGIGILNNHAAPRPAGKLQNFMIRSDLDQVGADIVLHMVASSFDSSRFTEDPELYYWRGIVDTASQATITWSPPVLLDSNYRYASSIVEASGASDQVAVVYTKEITPGHSGSNVWYRLSADGGLTWGSATNLTGFSVSDSDYAHLEVEAVYDPGNTLHILYNTTPDQVAGNLPSKLWHWNSVRQTPRLVVVADWVNTCSDVAPDHGDFMSTQVSKPSLSVKPAGAGPGGGIADELLHALWVQFGPTQTDCATQDAGGTLRGFVNGDLWCSISSDDGLTWDRPLNFTGSPSPDCLPGNCFSEHWVSSASVADSGIYISYMSDTHAGSWVQHEGAAAPGNAMVLVLESRAAVSSPRISIVPRVIPYPTVIMRTDYTFDLQPSTLAADSFALELRNVGTANLSVTMTVSEVDFGSEHLFINGDTSFVDVLSPGEELTGSIALMISYDGIGLQDGDTFDWFIYIQSNDPDRGDIILRFIVDVSGPSAQILGAKFYDANGNGIWDFPAEPGLPDWVIHAEPGGYVDTTDLTGAYFFSGLPAGTYTVSEELQPGWVQVSPGGAGTHTITLADGQTEDSVYFGNFEVDCLITLPGDVNVTGSVTSADIIYLVGFVFKGGVAPLPCEANGDVNCSGSVTSADIIYLVGFVFKGGTPPCDICTESPLPCQ